MKKRSDNPPHREGQLHEGLVQHLQHLVIEKQQLQRKMHQWEKTYHSLRLIEASLIKAYSSLHTP